MRCLKDHGEFEIDDGTVVLLKKNSQVRVQEEGGASGEKTGSGSPDVPSPLSTALPATVEMRAAYSPGHSGTCVVLRTASGGDPMFDLSEESPKILPSLNVALSLLPRFK